MVGGPMSRAALVAVLAAALTLALSVPAAAAPLPIPDPKPKVRVVDPYPAQMPVTGIGGQYGVAGAGFLSLPCLGDCHFVSSNFDHCGPNYASDGRICRFDGVTADAGNGRDPDAPTGYALSAGGSDYLYYDGHDGLDLGLYYEQVVAAADGTVTYADWSTPGCARCGFGQGIRIDHGNGFDTLYGHLWRINVGRGQRVARGQVIGVSGSTGNSTGEHLHFGVYHHGTWDPVDPYGWSGAGPDPWSHDAGNLWLNGAARAPAVALPSVGVTAEIVGEDAGQIALGWTSPGPGVTFDVVQYRDEEMGATIAQGASAGALTVNAEPGHRYWFEVTAHTLLGESDSAATPLLEPGFRGGTR